MPNSDEQGLTTPAPAPDGARAGENGAVALPARRSRAARPRQRATSDGSPAAAALGAALPDLAANAAPATSPSAPARIPRRRGNAGRTAAASAVTAVPATAIDAPVVAPDLVEVPGVHVEAAEAPVAVTPEAAIPRRRGISPENTIFVSLCFEGPDVYSTAGGLGTRVTEFTESLAGLGYETHLIFVGDPTAPSVEERVDGKLRLERWSQWISRYHLNGVYDGEERKLYDYNESVPRHVYYDIVAPAIAQGKLVVIIGEDWHTAEAICRVSDLLHWHGVRRRCILMWNCNSLMSLHRINWGRLNYCATITTVSRYMKHRLWQYNVNPLAIPNGIPSRYLAPIDQARAEELREIMRRGDPNRHFLFKIGRFDPDKRWLMAVEAVARLKYSGHPVAMVIR
ncbi:MAG TPA: glycosyltransferase, partial [Ktedonobacterales bacterium]|nr:glycosyltransferase [Ktedonobacterales bacterium]